MLKETLQADLKQAMLARDTEKVDVLKGLKSAILYEEVAKGKRELGLNDEEIVAVLKRESKKRQDAIGLYIQGGNEVMAKKEQTEKELIEKYLPESLSEEEVVALIDEAVNELGLGTVSQQDMGRIIGLVKSKGGASVDGSTVAVLVKARVSA